MQLKFMIILMLWTHQSTCATTSVKISKEVNRPGSSAQSKSPAPAKISSGMLQSSTKALNHTWNYIQSQLQQLHISVSEFISNLVKSTPVLLQQLSSLQRQHNNSTAQNQPINKILRDMEKDFVTLQTMKAQPEKYSQEQIEKITQDITDKFDLLNHYKESTRDQLLQQNIANFQATFTKLLSADRKQQPIESQHVTGKDTTSIELNESDAHHDAPVTSVDLKQESLSTQNDNVQATLSEKQDAAATRIQAVFRGDRTRKQHPLETFQLKALKQKSLPLSSQEIASKKQFEEQLLQTIEGDVTQLQDMLTNPTKYSQEEISVNIDRLLQQQSVYNELTTEITDREIKRKIKEKMNESEQAINDMLEIRESQRESAHKDIVAPFEKFVLPAHLEQKIKSISQPNLGTNNSGFTQATGKLETTQEYTAQEYIKKPIEREYNELKQEVDALTRQQAEALSQYNKKGSQATWQAYETISAELRNKQTTLTHARTIENLQQDLAPYSHVIDSRGDGNCGYRAIIVSMLVENLHNKKIVAHLKDLIQKDFTTMFEKYDTTLQANVAQDAHTYQQLQTYVLEKLDEINACQDIASMKKLIDTDTTFDYCMIMFERYKMTDLIDTSKADDLLGFFDDRERLGIRKNIGTWGTELDQPQTGLISRALETNIHTIELTKTVVQSITPNSKPIELSNTQNNAYILFTTGHYQLLVKKHDQPAFLA